MNQETIQVCLDKTSFERNVTAYQTKEQKAMLCTLLAGYSICLVLAIYQLSQYAWLSAFGYFVVALTSLSAMGKTIHAFHARIIRILYYPYYIQWDQWDRAGLEKYFDDQLSKVFTERGIGPDQQA